jgi:hypothetical protein
MTTSFWKLAISAVLALIFWQGGAMALPVSPVDPTVSSATTLLIQIAHKNPFKKSAHAKEKHRRHKAEMRDRDRRYYGRDRKGFHLNVGGDNRDRYYRKHGRYAGAPYGWRRYGNRPYDYRRRGCVLIGQYWFCP